MASLNKALRNCIAYQRISNSGTMNFTWGKPSNVKGTVFRKKKPLVNTDTKVETVQNVLKNTNERSFKKYKKKIERPTVHIKRKHKKDKQKLLNPIKNNPSEPPQQTKAVNLFHNSQKQFSISHSSKFESEKLFTDSGKKFSDLDIHKHLISNLEKINFNSLTTVQEKVIPIGLSRKDILVRSQTGSGKTLAYAVPIINDLLTLTPRLQRKDGLQVLVVVPTRELALQTHELVNKINTFQWIIASHLCGGENRKSEKDRLRKGVHILIGTPGRLLDHIFHTSVLKLNKVRCLVLDEADQLLDMGFRKDIIRLVEELNKARINSTENEGAQESNNEENPRQTMLLSASLTKGVSELADFVLKNHVFIDALEEEISEDSPDRLLIPNTIEQSYILTPVKNRLVTLSAIIVAKCKQTSKVFVFMASTQMVEYYYELFSRCLLRMPLNRGQYATRAGLLSGDGDDSDLSDEEEVLSTQFFKLHGSMDQKIRKKVFTEFRAAKSGVLFCTDVAARGIDVPTADCIIQYTGPQTDKDYLHRVGRTGRAGKSGSAIIFLTEAEEAYVARLQQLQVRLRKLNSTDFLNCLSEVMNEPDHERAARNLQQHYEDTVRQDKDLHFSACMAYSTWSRFYNSYPTKMRSIFDFKKVNLGHYANSFALKNTPSEISKTVRGEVVNMETPRLNQKLSNYKDEDVAKRSQGFDAKMSKRITDFFNLRPNKKQKNSDSLEDADHNKHALDKAVTTFPQCSQDIESVERSSETEESTSLNIKAS
ncbi:hypothetical protein RN001_006760 [Aquatica leii]|uniref:ATP-dependent RNA helicase n=1 Tax=Aquatica leii TaxID=1421715 RepID=A0AAN7SBM6_9COLE|nr:hypothetical protein RN001_006760 [Aquatica leii]